jgi:CBS domain containing-hemolysin-like protein
MPLLITILLVLLLFSGFFSMSETVYSSINPIRIKNAIDEKKKGSKRALWIHDHFDVTLSSILVGNNLANIALASVSLGLIAQFFQNNDALVAVLNTVIMTTIVLIFGEIIPKSYAKVNADKLALILAGPLYVLIAVLKPVTVIFIAIKKLFLRGEATVTITVTEEELETIIDTMEEEGSIDEDEAEMLQSVLDLSERQVYEIMTPRVDMIAINIEDSIDSIKETFLEHQFSRIPVFSSTRDNVIGILTERDFYTCLIKNEPFIIQNWLKAPIFVPRSMKVDRLIEILQKENMHLAVVTDEYGGTSGIVTMEDALEELVGEIYDEHDDIEPDYIQKESHNDYLVNADVPMDDLFDELDLGDFDNNDQSISAYLYDQFKEIPEEGHTHTLLHSKPSYDHDKEENHYEIIFLIKKMEDRRIITVLVTIHEIKEVSHE